MNEIKPLVTAFERFAYGQSLHEAFTELLDWTLLPFKKFETADQQLAAFNNFREHPKVGQLTSLITLIGELSEDFSDPVGELFMQVISLGHNGQYFTPTPLCEMIAIMNLGDDIEASQRVLDCACGSGRMLLAAGKINRLLHLYGADLDMTCCKMALLNMLFNSLTGEIAHMNSLSNEFYRGFKVCTTLVDTHYIPYYIEFLEAEHSYIWLHDLKGDKAKSAFDTSFEPVRAAAVIKGVQGTLF